MNRDNGLLWLERRLLHTVLVNPSALNDLTLLPAHFSAEKMGELFEFVVQANAGRTADFIDVAEMAERAGKPHVGALSAEIACDRDLWPSANLSGDIETILGAWRAREGRRIASALAEECGSRDDGAIDRAISALMALHSEQRNHEHTAQSAMRAAWDSLIAAKQAGGRVIGVPTGLSGLDDALGGLHDSDLIVIGARPSMGKTGKLLGMARAGAACGAVGLISAEQPQEQVGTRWMAVGSGLSVGRIRAGKVFADADWERASRAVREYGDLPIRILDRSSPDITEVIRVARRWKHQHGIRALYVDYLQRLEIASLMKSPKHERVGQVAKLLKNLARDLRIPVVALAQVSRSAGDARPTMEQLSDSSEIEKEADQIMMLWRDKAAEGEFQPAEINVVKNRHGNTGVVHCLWHGASTSFVDRAREDERLAA